MKYRGRQGVLEFTAEEDECLRILGNSCIREMDRIEVRECRKFCAARPRKGRRNAVNEIRIAITIKITVKDGKASEITVMRKRLKRQLE